MTREQKIADMAEGYDMAFRWLLDEDLEGWEDVDPSVDEYIQKRCSDFYEDNSDIIDRNLGKIPSRELGYYGAIGFDLYLTEQGHGDGFWDRGFPGEDGDLLTDAAGHNYMNGYVQDGILYYE